MRSTSSKKKLHQHHKVLKVKQKSATTKYKEFTDSLKSNPKALILKIQYSKRFQNFHLRKSPNLQILSLVHELKRIPGKDPLYLLVANITIASLALLAFFLINFLIEKPLLRIYLIFLVIFMMLIGLSTVYKMRNKEKKNRMNAILKIVNSWNSRMKENRLLCKYSAKKKEVFKIYSYQHRTKIDPKILKEKKLLTNIDDEKVSTETSLNLKSQAQNLSMSDIRFLETVDKLNFSSFRQNFKNSPNSNKPSFYNHIAQPEDIPFRAENISEILKPKKIEKLQKSQLSNAVINESIIDINCLCNMMLDCHGTKR